MKEIFEKECFDKHINMEIAYKKQYIDCGDDIQKGFTAGYISGLRFAKMVVKNNSKKEE